MVCQDRRLLKTCHIKLLSLIEHLKNLLNECRKCINLLCESQKANFRLKWNCKRFVILHIILIKLTVTLVLLVLWKLQIWKEQTLHFTLSNTACYHQIISCCQLTTICSNFLASVFYWEGGGEEVNLIAMSRCWLFWFFFH